MFREGNTTAQRQSWDDSPDVGLRSSCSFSLTRSMVFWTSLCLKRSPASASPPPPHHLEWLCICCLLRAVGPTTWAGRLQRGEGLTCR